MHPWSRRDERCYFLFYFIIIIIIQTKMCIRSLQVRGKYNFKFYVILIRSHVFPVPSYNLPMQERSMCKWNSEKALGKPCCPICIMLHWLALLSRHGTKKPEVYSWLKRKEKRCFHNCSVFGSWRWFCCRVMLQNFIFTVCFLISELGEIFRQEEMKWSSWLLNVWLL